MSKVQYWNNLCEIFRVDIELYHIDMYLVFKHTPQRIEFQIAIKSILYVVSSWIATGELYIREIAPFYLVTSKTEKILYNITYSYFQTGKP
jgi:hypothetical protein